MAAAAQTTHAYVFASNDSTSLLHICNAMLQDGADNQFIEGVAPPGDTEEEDVTAKVSAESVVKVYAGERCRIKPYRLLAGF